MRHRPIRNFIAVPASQNTLQKSFAIALLDPNLPVPVSVRDQPIKRYAVYRNNVTVGLVRALEFNFPAIRKLLGDVYFAGLAREFAQAHPPQSPLMFFYGNDFANFLEKQSDLTDYPYLGDVARLEQLCRFSYHELDAACLKPEAIAALNENELAELRLMPHPAFALFASRFAVHTIMQANRENEAAPVNLVAKPENVLITRPNLSVETKVIDQGTFTFLLALSNGAALGEAAENAFAIDSNLNLAECISTLLAAGAFQPLNVQG